MFAPNLAVIGNPAGGTPFAVVVTGGINGTSGNGGRTTGGTTGITGGTTGTGGSTGTGGTTGNTGGTGGAITGGIKPLSPYANDNAELIVLPNRLKEFVVEIVPVPAVFARKLDHKNSFCS